MIQQMIVSALSALGLSGNRNSIPKPWYFDSAVSNHMTNTALPLNNVQKYKGNLHIRTADGNPLSITAVGDISALLNTVFVSLKLSTNLIFFLPHFPESPTSVQRFKPGYVYHRRTPASDLSIGLTEVPSHLPAASDPVLPTSYDPPPLRKSSRPHKPPERYGFSTPMAMSTTLSSVSIPTCYK